ncbi:MAG TPA: hypothetical protein VIK32_16220 [Candidatus Limnocylindrales bacterium]
MGTEEAATTPTKRRARVRKVADATRQGAKVVARGVKAGTQAVKEHPKQTIVVIGAAVVAAGALPFVPWTVPAALGVIAAVGAGGRATHDAWKTFFRE